MRKLASVVLSVPIALALAAPARAAAPVLLLDPGISGSVVLPFPGATLTEIRAVWAPAPKSVSLRWVRCADGQSIDRCTVIAGATGRQYTLQPADSGFAVTVIETARNAAGQSASGVAAPTYLVRPPTTEPLPPDPPAPPDAVKMPKLSGTSFVGDTLTATPGSWSRPDGFTLTYQWLRCSSSCVTIDGATGFRYMITEADVGYFVTFVASATTDGGTASAISEYQQAARRPPPIRTLLRQMLALPRRQSTIPYVLRHGYHPVFVSPGQGGFVVITWKLAGRHGATIGEGHTTYRGLPKVKVPFRLSRQGRALLKRSRTVTVIAVAQFEPEGGGPPARLTRTLRLVRDRG